MSLFFPSIIPSNVDMYAFSTPKLKTANLCSFLEEMDLIEWKIQYQQDNDLDSQGENKVREMQEKRSGINKTSLKTSAIMSAACTLLVAVSGPVGLAGVIITEAVLMPPIGMFCKYHLEKFQTASEYNLKADLHRIHRLIEKISIIEGNLVVLKVKHNHVFKHLDMNQLVLANDFFKGNLKKYQAIKDKCPKVISYASEGDANCIKWKNVTYFNFDTGRYESIGHYTTREKISSTTSYTRDREITREVWQDQQTVHYRNT